MNRRTLFPVILAALISLLAVSAAQASTVRAKIAFSPSRLGTSGTSWVAIKDAQGHETDSTKGAQGIPQATLTGKDGDAEFTFTDLEQPSTRTFCIDFGYSTGGHLRPNLRGASASDTESGTVQVTLTDPGGQSGTRTFNLTDWENHGSAVTPDGASCSGEPVETCGSSPAQAEHPPVKGTASADRLKGTPDAECVQGEAGDDRLDGKGGDDFVDGGVGNDYVSGGAGKDTLAGGEGRDLLSDGLGANTYDAGPGDDVISARQSIGERIDCGPGKDLAIVDRKDHVTNCEEVEKPQAESAKPRSEPVTHSPKGKGKGKGHGKGTKGHRRIASISGIRWPVISHGWWSLKADRGMNFGFLKSSFAPNGLVCNPDGEQIRVAGVGAWNGGDAFAERRIEIQYRFMDITPEQFDSLNWLQKMAQAIDSPNEKSRWMSTPQFWFNYNWNTSLPPGTDRWVQMRTKWVTNAFHDKVKATGWTTVGECEGAW